MTQVYPLDVQGWGLIAEQKATRFEDETSPNGKEEQNDTTLLGF